MRKEYKVKLGRGGKFDHNVYITCECIDKTHYSWVMVDGVKIDFILEILSIEENV